MAISPHFTFCREFPFAFLSPRLCFGGPSSSRLFMIVIIVFCADFGRPFENLVQSSFIGSERKESAEPREGGSRDRKEPLVANPLTTTGCVAPDPAPNLRGARGGRGAGESAAWRGGKQDHYKRSWGKGGRGVVFGLSNQQHWNVYFESG